MKKSVGIVIALVVTVLTIGTAFAIQHQVSQNQPVSVQERATAKPSSSESTSSSDHSEVESSQQSHKRSTQGAAKRSSSNMRRRNAKRASTVKTSKANKTAKTPDKQVNSKRRKQTNTSSVAITPKASSVEKNTASQDKKLTITLKVSGYKKTFFNDHVKVKKGSSVFDVLQASKLKIDYQNGVVVYVSGVNGLKQNDIKSGSGWKYRVNGKFIDKPANLKKVKNHDSVHWYFTTEGY